MIYELKNCRTGEAHPYRSAVEITEDAGIVTFRFTAEHTAYYCCASGYNKIHSAGDACEVLIGSDPARRFYYEIEISPKNELMLALMEYKGEDENGPVLEIHFVDDCFVTSSVTKTAAGYIAELHIPKDKIRSGDGEIYFNAYRLETDGGETDKHLMALIPTMRPKFHTPAYFAPLKDYVNK